VFRREFIHIGNIEVFVESIKIASAGYVLRKRFLQPDTIGLIPTGGYASNNKYSKKELIWLLHMEEPDGVKIMYGRNGCDYSLPELPGFSVDGCCTETRKIYESFGCQFHGHTFQPFRDVITMSGDKLPERYERTMSHLEQITREVGYVLKVQWECEFDDSGIVKKKPELLTHPIVLQNPLRTRDAVYGARTEAMRLDYKGRENGTILYVNVTSVYHYICKYIKFPVSHPDSMPTYGGADQMFDRSAREVVSPRPPFNR